MSEVGRHSVDVPISKALVALRRVRSLRDPSTNSIRKLPASVDNLSWETSSCNGVSLGLENVCDWDDSDHHSLLGSQNYHLDGRCSDPDSDHSSRRPVLKFNSSKKSRGIGIKSTNSLRKTNCIEGSSFSISNFDGILEERSLEGRNDSDYRKKELDLSWTPHSSSHLSEDVNSYSKTKVESARLERIDTTLLMRRSRYRKLMESSMAGEDAVGSRVGSPCLSMSDPRMDGSSMSTPLLVNEEVDIVDSNHRGCGISCCWSRTPKFRDGKFHPVAEDHPLLSADGRETAHSVRERRSEYFKRELSSYSDSPRSLSQKFRPRSFRELVGQHVVIQSLLSAILNGKVAPLYLFHGPHGTGKTSTSRIFAAALNCLSAEELRPCGFCQECVLFYSGRGRDVNEVDIVKTNHTGRIKTLLKHAALAPVSSRYKVFIIDECQLLRGETWSAFLNSIEELPRYVVFLLITSDPDKLPRSAVSRCQRYHFPKIRDTDIVSRLQDICVEEDLDFEEEALHFIAAKSNGSLRDAETMLDQLSLLGKRITISLAYELIGTVSDDDLLDLLDLALSSDTSNTVRRARELMKSRVDPMQLISQLANLIMDILAGKWLSGSTAVGRKLFRKRTLANVDLEKLRHALKILSETEKQLRSSKNQTTWLTVALLQLSTRESTMLDGNESKMCLKMARRRGGDFCRTSILKEGLDHSVPYRHNHNESQRSDLNDEDSEKLEAIWSRTIEKCQSITLKRFLQKEGKLLSVSVSQGLAVAEVEFCHPNHVSKAEKSWKLIARSLQLVLGCNVEIRISLGSCTGRKNAKVKKKPTFNLLNCSCGLQGRSFSTTVDGGYQSDTLSSTAYVKQETLSATHSSHHRCHFSPAMQQPDAKRDHNVMSFHHKDALTIRNLEGNALSTGTTASHRTVKDDLPNGCGLEIDSSKAMGNQDFHYLGVQEPKTRPSCFSRTLELKRMLESPVAACTICLRFHPNNKFELSIPKKSSIGTYFCTDDPFILCSGSKTQMTHTNSSGDENVSRKESTVSSKLRCWEAPKFQIRKAQQHKRQNRRRSRLAGWFLHCSTAKKFRGLN